ncbi:hypothetical protein ACQKMV_07725 [Lysinibacillus sp. NPDC094403]|uniref:hypothetical protein n=1 Tax=Lysinibacillus sp. NPDC094403 TaxID=3390581 RepID=UPI003D0251BB
MNYYEKLMKLLEARDNGIPVTHVPNTSNLPMDYDMTLDLYKIFPNTIENADDRAKAEIDEMMMHHFPGEYDVTTLLTVQEKFAAIVKAINRGLYLYDWDERMVDNAFVETHRQVPALLDDLDIFDKIRLERLYDNIEKEEQRLVAKQARLQEIEQLKQVDYDRREEVYVDVPVLILDWDSKVDFGALNLFELEDYVKQIHREIISEYRPAIKDYLKRVETLRKDVWGRTHYDRKTKVFS